MARFTGQVAVITGGVNGIGEATARRLTREGAAVYVMDIDDERGQSFQAAMRRDGFDVTFVCGSVADELAVNAVYTAVAAGHGRLDVLFNNAGIYRTSYCQSTRLTDWRQVLSINLDGVFLMSRHAIPMMVATGGGAIVNTSSICGHIATEGALSYNTSKHAIEGLTKSIALEHARDGIRANTVCPGFVNTAMGRADVDADPTIPSRHPLGRIAEADEIASAVAFLASSDASFVTGTSLLVDGGYTAQ